jgi:hypothetical protein
MEHKKLSIRWRRISPPTPAPPSASHATPQPSPPQAERSPPPATETPPEIILVSSEKVGGETVTTSKGRSTAVVGALLLELDMNLPKNTLPHFPVLDLTTM